MNKIKFKQTETCGEQSRTIGEIPEGWEIREIGECFEVCTGKGIHKSDRRPDGTYPIMGANGIIGYSDEFLVDGEYILTGRVGTLGEVAYNAGKFWISDNSIFIGNEKQGDLKFLYYYLKTFDFQTLNVGSTQPLVKQSDIKKIKFPFPPVIEQCAIAKILSDLDDKIELNRQMNKALESIAQVIFKRWFVDFEFPGYEKTKFVNGLPEEWEYLPLDQIADFLNGLALQKYPPKGDIYLPVIKIRELNQGITESTDKASAEIDPAYIVDDGDVLFSWSGSLDVIVWGHGKGALNQHLFKVTSQKYPKWFYYFWIKQHLPDFQHIAAGKATTMGHIQRHHLSDAIVLTPPKEILQTITEVAEPMINKIINNLIEIRKLREIRDSLLPRLMSGKIRVR